MKRHEAMVIALLVAVALCVPVALLAIGVTEAAERDWRDRPYEGTIDQFWQAHAGLLEEAAAILWRHEAYYAGLLGEWDEEWQIGREDFRGECRAPFEEAEWAVLQRVFGEQMCSAAIISWWHVPHVEFCIPTAEDGSGRLLQIPAGCDAGELEALLAALRYIGMEDVKKTAHPEWYAAIWRERTWE